MYEKFCELCNSKGVTRSQASKDLHISNATISNWKNRGSFPTIEIVIRMSEYFGCSIEELMSVKSQKSENDLQLLTNYGEPFAVVEIENKMEKLTDQQLKRLIAYANYLLTR